MSECQCVGLYDIERILSADDEFVKAYGKKVKYPTIVKWVQSGKFATAHKINGGMWVVNLSEVQNWKTLLELPVVGAVNYTHGKRREWSEFYRHYVPLLAAAFPYESGNIHAHTLKVLRENHPWIPEGDEVVERTVRQNPDFATQGGYPRKVLARKLTEYFVRQMREKTNEALGD